MTYMPIGMSFGHTYRYGYPLALPLGLPPVYHLKQEGPGT